ncbi:MAG TPA: cytochrome C oxidase subunit IV family protein [Cytophagaceae bacterium]
MAHAHDHEEHVVHHVHPPDAAKIRKIWLTAGILAFVTAIEFLMAFTMDRGVLLITGFVLLTFVKSFYIVAEFMHLKYEVKSLIWSIVLPVIFIVWLVVALLIEGDAILTLRNIWMWYFN